MRSFIFTTLFSFLSLAIFGQTSIMGVLQDDKEEAVSLANVALYNASDSTMVKVETTDDAGVFRFPDVAKAQYFIKASFVGLTDLEIKDINYVGDIMDLGVLTFTASTVALDEITVKADRALVEVKPGKTIFNVQGTINSAGEDAIALLRKAPSVTVDNNDNISVLGRSGVMIYIDGKQVPLSGDDLSNYLRSLTAEQIDRIDIITNPGAKYDAEGNAGIVDIILKKDKNHGANGSVSGAFTQGKKTRYNMSTSGNYRNKKVNVFGLLGYGKHAGFHDILFKSEQNDLYLDEINNTSVERNNLNYRLGTDYFITKNSTVGFLYSGSVGTFVNSGYNEIAISQLSDKTNIDSVLIASNVPDNERTQNSINLNYAYNTKKRSFNADFDYGLFDTKSKRFQPNTYFAPNLIDTLSSNTNNFITPTKIGIYTAKLDYEKELFKGRLGLGVKFSRVETENTFDVYNFDKMVGMDTLNLRNSNLFDYDENVYAGYVSYKQAINKQWNISAGLRAEQTIADGVLTAYVDSLQQPPVELNYLKFFPNIGLTYTKNPQHNFALNYGRRINRPDYNVLNPFNNQMSELSFEKGNPFLRPEIVNNIEFGYTYAYRFNFKLGFSQTVDQITRIIGPDDSDDRAGFISWDNLAKQEVISFNASLPFQFSKKWNAYFNFTTSYIDNQADYGDGAVVDVQVLNYVIYQQHTINLPKGFKAEVSGYFSGPGIWGGVFKYDENWSLNLGLQKKFLNDKLNVKLSANDIFYASGWQGVSSFNGLTSRGQGQFDSRNVSLSASYSFGNQNVKSRKRKTGLEDESKRVGE